MRIIFFPILLSLTFNINIFSQNLFIRLNQVGFLPGDIKTGIVISENKIEDESFHILNSADTLIVFSGKLSENQSSYGNFKYIYNFNFSKFNTTGSYVIRIDRTTSYAFTIDTCVYNSVVDSLLKFFQVQRCGSTKPYLHKECHLSDATELNGFADSTVYNLTGGWHDAGDYIKFFSTTALTTYMLLFSYQFDEEKFGFDNDGNNIPDILEEAKVGLDWLLKCNFSDTLFVLQVQDENDHKVGWRMPEDDSLAINRPGFTGIGRNQIGIFSAVMALASQIWIEKFNNDKFSNDCLTAAVQKFSLIGSVPEFDTVSTYYKDHNYFGKLALGAIELYNATAEDDYLQMAATFADSAGSDFWWSWGDINSLADYKIAKVLPRFSDKIKANLNHFNLMKDSTLFNRATIYSWGTTTSLLGAALQAILYKKLTSSDSYDSLLIFQRDYILGRNPWGISFITNAGKNFPGHPHHQIAYFIKDGIPGALVAGPAKSEFYKKYNVKLKENHTGKFNTKDAEYFDDWEDYLSNEATIFGNATALFVYGNYMCHR